MKFFGYSSKDLDAIESKFTERFQRIPIAFMARSPFGITGKRHNLVKLVISQKHCGNNAVFVPLVFDSKQELEEAIMALGEIKQMIYVDRRKLEKAIEIAEIQAENHARKYARHCPYCGAQYIADVVKPAPHCGKPRCDLKHGEHLELQRKLRQQSKDQARAAVRKSSTAMPEINLDDPASQTLQGYVYCIRAENGLCKIGRSSDVASRFSDIVGASPVNVYLEHTVFSNNYVLAESYAHQELEQYRHHGEWFDLPENVFDWFVSLDNYDLDAP